MIPSQCHDLSPPTTRTGVLRGLGGGTWGAITPPVLLRVWLTCVLVLASASAWAQSADATSQAQGSVVTNVQKVGQLATQRAKIAQSYHDELAAVDRLKLEKASWRRDRELRTNLADSADTANQLATLDQQLAAAQRMLSASRAALIKAIEAELALATGPRAQQLAQLRAQQQALLGAAPKKIVLPDAEIDPLADPEELDQQVQAITETEKQLATQLAGLDTQAVELAHVADLRRHHDRANDMMLRDDDQPHRNAQPSSSVTLSASASPTSGGATSDTFTNGDHASSFESEATFVLGEVIDRSTIESLASASRSGDPTKRADAAKLARDAVAQRLDSLRKKRQQIELRAKQLRATH